MPGVSGICDVVCGDSARESCEFRGSGSEKFPALVKYSDHTPVVLSSWTMPFRMVVDFERLHHVVDIVDAFHPKILHSLHVFFESSVWQGKRPGGIFHSASPPAVDKRFTKNILYDVFGIPVRACLDVHHEIVVYTHLVAKFSSELEQLAKFAFAARPLIDRKTCRIQSVVSACIPAHTLGHDLFDACRFQLCQAFPGFGECHVVAV